MENNIIESHKVDVRRIIKERKDYYFEHVKAYKPTKIEVEKSNDITLKMNAFTWEHVIGEFHFLYGVIEALLDNVSKYDITINKETKEKLEKLDKETAFIKREDIQWVLQELSDKMSAFENNKNKNNNGENGD